MTNIEEIWVDIDGFDNYQVSNLGNVRNKSRNKAVKPNTYGRYYRIKLYKNKKDVYRSLHRIVAINLIDNPENKPCVCHRDNNTANNSIYNLYWGTHKENTQQALREGRLKSPFTKKANDT